MLREIINQKENLHHAYLVEGDFEVILPQLMSFIENNLCLPVKNNPDFWLERYETFGIDEGRRINELQSKRPFQENKKIFIIKTNSITREAQNSLLKMFEEPASDTHFFIIVDSSEIFLPTLKSRMMLIRPYEKDSLDTEMQKFAEKFVKSSLSERLNMVKNFFGDTKKKIPADKNGSIKFLNEIEKYLRKDFDFKKAEEKDIIVFEEINKCRSYLNDRSPSVKMLLEHIAVIV